MKKKPPELADFGLWTDIAQSIKPLRGTRRVTPAREPPLPARRPRPTKPPRRQGSRTEAQPALGAAAADRA